MDFRVARDRGLDADRELRHVLSVGVGTLNKDGASFGWRLPASSLVAIRPGVYWWQAVATGADGTRVPGPLRPMRVTLPAAGLVKGTISSRYGKQGRGGFAITVKRKPSEVSRARLWSVAATSARRWGLRAEGWTTRRPVSGDGISVLGFGPLPRGVMGLTRSRVRRDTGVTVEADVILNDRLRWEEGPDYPWFDEADLETVVLHELGHFAGNHSHVSGCTSSPLNRYGSLGEWWRAPGDRFRLDCTRVTRG